MKILFIVALNFLILQPIFSQKEKKTPLISAYFGAAIPIVSVNKNEVSTNFTANTSLVFPIGINLKKSPKFSYSIELDPVITWSKHGSLVSNFAFLPGVLLHQQKVTYGIRAAFETKGKYGMSFSLLKSLIKGKNYDLVLGLPLDLRLGSQAPASIGSGIIIVVVL